MDPDNACLISLNAYNRIYPDSFFRKPLKKKDLEFAKKTLVFKGFCKLSELAKEEKDYFLILRMIEHDVDGVYGMIATGDIESFREKFEELKSRTDKQILDKFHSYFNEEMKKL